MPEPKKQRHSTAVQELRNGLRYMTLGSRSYMMHVFYQLPCGVFTLKEAALEGEFAGHAIKTCFESCKLLYIFEPFEVHRTRPRVDWGCSYPQEAVSMKSSFQARHTSQGNEPLLHTSRCGSRVSSRGQTASSGPWGGSGAWGWWSGRWLGVALLNR
jgi:hypothetical protein